MKPKNKKLVTSTVIIGAVMSMHVSAATVIPITNPSFTTDTAGWTWTGGSGSFGRSTTDGAPDGASAAIQNLSGMYQQTNASITIGTTYQLDFIARRTAGAVKQITVNFHDGSLASLLYTQTLTLTNTWDAQSVSYTAASTTGNNLMISFSGANADGNWGGIDNVSLTSIPEPSSQLLLGAGIGGALLLRRRRI